MIFDCVTRTHVGLKRKINEDAVLARPDLGVWAVADGMGGHDAGEVASALVVEMLGAVGAGLDVRARAAAAHLALSGAHERLTAMAQAGPGGGSRTIGSTVVALVADGVSYICLWAGDSRGYLWRDGALVQLTRDHSLVQTLVDAGELDPADAQDHPNANVVLRAVGASGALGVDAVDGLVRPGDRFLLASDGLTRLVSDAELAAALGASDQDAAADRLIALVLERGAPDNVSLVMLRAR
jgi:serine/threonine-protein phosphatase Stp1